MKFNFTKVEGSGNDFILIDNRKGNISYLTKRVKRKLCSRKKGVGADGILILEKDYNFPFLMRYYNADGGEAEMCGNGARCAALYVYSKGFVSRKFSFRSKSSTHNVEILKANFVKVELPPCEFKRKIRLKIEGKPSDCFFLKVGVPHIVIFTENIEKIDVLTIGKRVRNLKIFGPQGTNVNFVRKDEKNRLTVRTYERGIETETLSCGTGAAASSAVAYRGKMVNSPVYVIPKSGESIKVFFTETKSKLIPYLLAKTHIVFSGTVEV
ncbi:MAG: diaminopimelate epimerase [Candidatus Cloacimonadota bacterium]|nr:MAG: diaminopimelate epimerase [Candidatus Cloacimonadota bacterium]